MDLFKEISIPITVVKTPEGLAVMALPISVPRKGSEFLILQDKRRNPYLDLQCQVHYEFTLAVSFF